MVVDALTPGMIELEVKGFGGALDVLSFSGRERLSSLYAFDVVVESELEWEALCKPMLSAAACLRFRGPDGSARAVRGIVSRVDARGRREAKGPSEYRIRIVPRLWLLGQRHGSRIFQDATVREIVAAVLDGKRIAHRWAATAKLASRAYTVQYEESDLDFVSRLLAEEGIFYFFEPPPESEEDDDSDPGDVVVFGDAPACYAPIPACDDDVIPAAPRPKKGEKLAPAPALPMRHDGGRVAGEVVHRFGLRRQVRTTKLELRDYEYQRPHYRSESQASVFKREGKAAEVPLDTMMESVSLEGAGEMAITHYDHRAAGQEARAGDWAARILLEQLRAEAASGTGRSNCRRLAPGYRFVLEDSSFDADYVVTEIRHRGHIPERARSEAAKTKPPYANRFACVKSRIPFRPPQPKFRVQQVLETATVVGPGQAEGTVCTDALGRIKVHFHWDRDGTLDDTASCWIRVSQAWAGQGMGVQFIPRVGMEVIVGFLGGDIDRPIVLGAAHNATHPVPFALPSSSAVSGVRSRSIGSDGYNELSFDDTPRAELLSIRAERDLALDATRDLAAKVGNDRTIAVQNDDDLRVTGSARRHVGRNRDDAVDGDHASRVKGNRSETIEQNQLVWIGGNSAGTVTGSADRTVSADLATLVGGKERREVVGAQDVRVGDDLTLRVHGCHVVLVGKNDAKRSYLLHVEGTSQLSSSGVSEIWSEKALVLRCGDSQIKLTPKNIEISSPEILLKGKDALISAADGKAKVVGKSEAIVSAETVRLAGKGAGLTLDANAKLEAGKIALASGSAQAEKLAADPKAPPPTTISLVDQDGKPVAHARYVLLFDDGAEQSGFLDQQGKAELTVDGSPKILFPELSEVKPA